MRRIARATLGSGLMIAALAPALMLADPPGALARQAGTAARAEPAAAASSQPSSTPSPTPTRSAKPSQSGRASHSPPPKPQVISPTALPPVPGMPTPGRNCLARSGQGIKRTLTVQPWAQRALNFGSVWGLSRGQHVTVAVVDSGIDFTRQLRGRVAHADLTGGNGEDCVGHGTAVASIIAASKTKGVSFYGVAPAAHILSIRVQRTDSTGTQSQAQQLKTLVNIAQGIRYAVTRGAQVINVSIQVPGNVPALRSAVEYALRHNVVVVAAAGNNTNSANSTNGGYQGPFYPASYPGVLSVNAVRPDGQLANFDVRNNPVSVTAPGVNVAAGYAFGEFTGWDGTSFATAFVSGEAALVRSAHPRFSAAQVVQRIEATADGHAGAHTGFGMINPVQAVNVVLPHATPSAGAAQPVLVPARRRVNSSTRTIALSVTGGAIATACLVAVGAIVVPQGRRRHWRPGRLGEPAIIPAPPADKAPAGKAPAGTTPADPPSSASPQSPATQRPSAAPWPPPPASPPLGGPPLAGLQPRGRRHRRRRG